MVKPDGQSTSMAEQPGSPRVRRGFRGTGLYWSLILALLLAVAILVGIIQNLQTVELKYFGWDLRTPLVVVLLVTILATVVLAALAGAIWRRRRRQQLTDRDELRELRQRVDEPVAVAPPPPPETQ